MYAIESEVIVLNLRLKSVRKALSMNQESFGARLGVSNTAISKLENGENGITEQMIKSICREFNVNEQWFRAGTGEMFLEASGILSAEQIKGYNLNELDTHIVEEFMKLAPDHRQMMRDYILAVAKSLTVESATEVAPVAIVGPATEPPETPYPYEKDFDSMTRKEKLAAFARELDEQEKGQISQESTDVFSDATKKMA